MPPSKRLTQLNKIQKLLVNMAPELLFYSLAYLNIKEQDIIFKWHKHSLSLHPGVIELQQINNKVYLYANLATIDRNLQSYCMQIISLFPSTATHIDRLLTKFLRVHFLALFPKLNPKLSNKLEYLPLSYLYLENIIKRTITLPCFISFKHQYRTTNHRAICSFKTPITRPKENHDILIINVSITAYNPTLINEIKENYKRLTTRLNELLIDHQLIFDISHPKEVLHLSKKTLGQTILLQDAYSYFI